MYIKGSPEYEHHIKTYGEHKSFGYKDFIPMLKGENFDAREWMALIKESGAEYVMPVAEHHDGFQMYESELSEFNAKNMGPKRDVLGQLKEAALEQGIMFALSNHRAELIWFFNGGLEFESDVADPANEAYYGKQQAGGGESSHDIYAYPPTQEHCEQWLCRLVELVEKYKPSIVYFDWWIHNIGFKPYIKKFAAYYYNRAIELGFEAAINYKHHAFPPGAAILDVERGSMNTIQPRIWQACTAMAFNSWGYTKTNEYKSSEEIIQELIDVVSKNGRLLLNIGPRADGVIADEEKELLRKIGKWLFVNGEGIYKAGCWEVFGEKLSSKGTSVDIRYTCKANIIYAFLMSCPPSGRINLKALKRNRPDTYSGGDFDITSITQLGSNENIPHKRDKKSLQITLENASNNEYPVCIKVVTD
jgi:alpha-L-fucosidase